MVTLRNILSSAPEAIYKIRFQTRHEFWAFVAHAAFARVHAYNQTMAEPGRASGSGEVVLQEQIMAED